MAVGKIMVSAGMPGLKELVDNLGRILPGDSKAVILAEALDKAIQPAYHRLYETSPVGPTGNLRAARAYKVVKYPPGVAVAILGYRRTGKEAAASAAGGSVQVATTNRPDRAFHQWFLERGTQPRYVNKLSTQPFTRRAHQRRTKSGEIVDVREHQVRSQGGYIASSFRRLGPFRIVKGSDPNRVETDPPYQRAFFKKSKNPIVIQPMRIGGFTGRPPLETAWRDTQAQVAEYLQRELSLSLEQALSALTYTATGTVG